MILQSCSRRFCARHLTMPLRAKILNPSMTANASRQVSSSSASAPSIQEEPGDEPRDVLFNTLYGLRTIQLNRPKKLNSLNGSMIRKIIPRLQEWEKSQLANIVVIKGEGRAFCAGGDVAALAQQNEQGPEGQQKSTDYFALEYQLDHLIATYSKPYVAFMDGITMGGGVGLSVHAPFRIATENTVFAMPETTIGFFPDVGASFFLSRLEGQLGLYLALTSDQLKGANVFYSGVASHYLHSSSLPDLEARLSELQFSDNDGHDQRLALVNATIEEFTTGLPHDQPISAPVAGEVRVAIDYIFQKAHSIEDMMQELERFESLEGASEGLRSWAVKTRQTIQQRSPTSVRVALKQIREGKTWSIAQTFRREHSMAARFMRHPDFVEGVSSLLIRKPKTTPKWQPAELSQVSKADVDAFFAGDPSLQLLKADGQSADYTTFPHARYGLPSEDAVYSSVRDRPEVGKEQIVVHWLRNTNHKLGVREKVNEILDRKTAASDRGIKWKTT